MASERKWLPAESITPEDEGKEAWVYCAGATVAMVHHGYIPGGYSRRPEHCRGFYYMLIDRPEPPEHILNITEPRSTKP